MRWHAGALDAFLGADPRDRNDRFGLETLAQEYLPNSQQAVTTLNELAQQQSFKAVLDEARQDAKKAGNKVNKSICEEVSVYKNS